MSPANIMLTFPGVRAIQVTCVRPPHE